MTSTSDFIGPGQQPTEEDIERRFKYHKPNDYAINHITDLRNHCNLLANLIRIQVPDGREKSLAITKLEETMMWAIAGIARDPRMQEAQEWRD